MRNIFFITLILIALGGSYYYWNKSAKELPVYNAPDNIEVTDALALAPSLTEVPILITEKRMETNPAERFVLNIEYPKLVLGTTPTVAQQTNDVIKGVTDRLVDAFMADANETKKNSDIPSDMRSELTVRYQPLLISPSFISIRFDSSAYIRGAAHPDNQSKILNYDLVEHALLETSDLFAPGGDYLDYLSNYTRGALRGILTEMGKEDFDSFVIPGTAPIAENFKLVGLTNNGISIIFNPYQVAPYARGSIEVVIPYSVVSPKLAPEILKTIERSVVTAPLATTTIRYAPEGSEVN